MEEKVKAFLELATQKKASDIFIIAGRPLSVKLTESSVRWMVLKNGSCLRRQMNLSGSFTSLLTTGI